MYSIVSMYIYIYIYSLKPKIISDDHPVYGITKQKGVKDREGETSEAREPPAGTTFKAGRRPFAEASIHKVWFTYALHLGSIRPVAADIYHF
jgi:hypothetical protein